MTPADRPRPDAATLVAHPADLSVRVMPLTRDNAPTAAAAVARVGLHGHAVEEPARSTRSM
jgi:cation transport ATPase